jgi:hypothetical protein
MTFAPHKTYALFMGYSNLCFIAINVTARLYYHNFKPSARGVLNFFSFFLDRPPDQTV